MCDIRRWVTQTHNCEFFSQEYITGRNTLYAKPTTACTNPSQQLTEGISVALTVPLSSQQEGVELLVMLVDYIYPVEPSECAIPNTTQF